MPSRMGNNVLCQLLIDMPVGADILTVQMQDNMPFIWALVNPNETNRISRCLELYGTGHNISYEKGEERKYIGTFQFTDCGEVYHLFERTN